MKDAKRFKVVECRGTAYEIGLQWGEGCKESIAKAIENTFNTMMMYFQAPREEVVARAMHFLPRVQEFDPYLIEIMRGQADSTGFSFEEIFTQRCVNELETHYYDLPGLCTSFAATGRATQGGKTFLGQNVDWQAEKPVDLLKIHHTNGPVQLVISLASCSELVLSSAGFGICGLSTIEKDYSANIPVACYLPKAMRQQNITEAMDIFKQAARGVGYYHLADAKGQMCGFESIHNGDFEMIYPENDLLFHSNHYLTERFKKGDIAPEFILDSYTRLDRIRDLMSRHYGAITPEIAMEVLTDHDNHPESICRHFNPNVPISTVTLTSFIMLPEEGALYITCGHPCKHEYVRYEL